MNKYSFGGLALIASVTLLFFANFKTQSSHSEKFEIYKIDLKSQSIQMYWKDDQGVVLKNFAALKNWLKTQKKEVKFAMNGGMFHEGGIPVGLYIENGKQLNPLDTGSGNGNFYLKPNGIFALTKDKKALVTETSAFKNSNILFATQSGPMLVINNHIHGSFNKTSTNLNIRNGVGVASPTEIYFVISKTKVNFYEMAPFFKEELKCPNALYLDGFVSKTYLPEKKMNNLDGDFGVIIAEVK